MKCFKCNVNCHNGSYKCWNCGHIFKRTRPYIKNVKIQKNYYQKKDDESGTGLFLGLAAVVGGFLYLTKDTDKSK